MTHLAKNMTIFHTILNTKVSWDAMPESIIMKCFRQCGTCKHTVQQEKQLGTTGPDAANDFDVTWRNLGWVYIYKDACIRIHLSISFRSAQVGTSWEDLQDWWGYWDHWDHARAWWVANDHWPAMATCLLWSFFIDN